MSTTIQAIYEKGVIKPLSKLKLSERQRVTIRLIADDVPAAPLTQLATKSPSYDFLKSEKEDVYSIKDGTPV